MAPITVTTQGIATTYDFIPPAGTSGQKNFSLSGANRILVGYKFTVSIPCSWNVPPTLVSDPDSGSVTRANRWALAAPRAWQFWNVDSSTMLTQGTDDFQWNVTAPYPSTVSLVPGVTYCFFSILTSAVVVYYYTSWPLKDIRFSHLYDQVSYTHISGAVTTEAYAADNVIRKSYSNALPYPMNSFMPVTKDIGTGAIVIPDQALGYALARGVGEYFGLDDGGFEFKFSYTTNVTLSTPEEPIIYPGASQFSVTLPTEWRLPDLKQWVIEYAISSDNGKWSDWLPLISVPATQFVYVHTNVDVNKYYRYRYRVETRANSSVWSEMGQAGIPKGGIQNYVSAGIGGFADANATLATAAGANTNKLSAPKNAPTVFVGPYENTAGYAATDYSGALRFSGLGVAWGDLAYYPTATNGHFKLYRSNSIVGDAGTKADLSIGALFGTAATTTGNITAGTTNLAMMGNHPTYGTANYAAWWRSGSDYTLLTSAADTFLNAPGAAGLLRFRANNTENAYLDSGGNFFTYRGVFPGYYLSKTVQASWGIYGHASYGLYINTGLATANNIWCGNTLSFGAPGTISSNYAIQGNDTYGIYCNTGIYAVGNVWAAGYPGPSDKRLKKNVRDIIDPIDKLQAINGIWHEWAQLDDWTGPEITVASAGVDDSQVVPETPLDPQLNNGSAVREEDTVQRNLRKILANKPPSYGFIAQDVLLTLPEVVSYDVNSDIYSIEYNKMLPILWEALKVAIDRIAILETKVK